MCTESIDSFDVMRENDRRSLPAIQHNLATNLFRVIVGRCTYMELTEKKELIVQSFQESYDKDMAYRKLGLTEEEKVLLDGDKEFQQRLDYFLILKRETLIRRLDILCTAENDATALKAILELGKILYTDAFEKTKENGVSVNIGSLTPDEEKRVNEEYGILLGDKSIYLKRKDNNS